MQFCISKIFLGEGDSLFLKQILHYRMIETRKNDIKKWKSSLMQVYYFIISLSKIYFLNVFKYLYRRDCSLSIRHS